MERPLPWYVSAAGSGGVLLEQTAKALWPLLSAEGQQFAIWSMIAALLALLAFGVRRMVRYW